MSQPIITTDISAIRPVFSEGTAENIKRYTQLKKMFHHGKEYSVLAEPMLDGPNKITWHTEFEGTPQPFSKLTEEERNAAKGGLKMQVNKLYKAVFKQLYRNSMSDVADMFAILDSCIEIPDYDNIYRILRPDGKSKFVIIKWGFISDDFKAQTELIKKLVPTAVDTVKIKVIKNQKAASNETVKAVFNGKPISLTTDSKGCVFLEDIPLGASFSVMTPDGETKTEYLCDGSDEYHFLIGTKSLDMNFVFADQKGVPLAETEITFTYDGRTYLETTDSKGRISLRDIPEGTEVTVKQRNSKQTFVCDSSVKEYAFTGSRPTSEIDVAVMDSKGNFLPGIDVKFTYLNKEMTVSTDRNGRVSIDNLPIETEFKIECSGKKYQSVSTSLFTHEGLNMTEIRIKKIAAAADMTIRVVDEKGSPIVNTLIRCDIDDMRTELFTNENGEVFLDKVNYNSNVVCTQIINTLAAHRHVFLFTPETKDYVFKGGVILEKSEVTALEIIVVNKQKEKIPNLRVTIDDGHNALNRITDNEGRIKIDGLKHGKYTVSTEYKNKNTEIECEFTKETEVLKLVVGRNNLGFLFWLIPLLILLGWLVWMFLIPKLKEISEHPIVVSDKTEHTDNQQVVPVVTDSVKKADTLPAPVVTPEVKKGLTMKIIDEKTGKGIPNAKITVEFKKGKDKVKLDGTADENGVFNFETVPEEETLQINARVEADKHSELITTFLFTPDKTVTMSEFSFETNDIPVECGTTVKSKGFHSTIQTVRLGKTSGTTTIGFDTFDIPDEVIVYNGKASDISDKKIIYKSNGFVKGPYKKVQIKFNDPDGLVTVRINGGDNKKTEWYFKVYCPPSNKK